MIEPFDTATSKAELESGTRLLPRFDSSGLVTAVVTDAGDGMVLMVAHMNAEALARTIETGQAWYWSRSRQELWLKGATSGETQRVVEIRTDCDQDAIWIKVETAGKGAACHTGMRSCFYRRVENSAGGPILVRDDEKPRFDPEKVYGGRPKA
ncbi:MAG: phosphoribosyl-AMP cyclohydrolase [Nitratireductor sp.]|nr:phosphoribosyl-AMP cyclohydrolase [Nitratireductor sp.]MCB1458462.1 phosphoribosyl-AMP cyclohydrolase [Nitratireductor sp.]